MVVVFHGPEIKRAAHAGTRTSRTENSSIRTPQRRPTTPRSAVPGAVVQSSISPTGLAPRDGRYWPLVFHLLSGQFAPMDYDSCGPHLLPNQMAKFTYLSICFRAS